MVLCLVVVTRLVRDSDIVRVLVHAELSTALARPGVSAVDDVLDGEVSTRPGPLPRYVDAVRECAGRATRPAGSTICGYVIRTWNICVSSKPSGKPRLNYV